MKKIIFFILIFFLIITIKGKENEKSKCYICKFLVEAIKRRVNDSEDKILAILTGLCEFLPDENDKIECKKDLTDFGRQLIRFVKENFNQSSEEICKKHGQCAKNELSMILEKLMNK
jgi:hypothetical protein